MPWMLYNALLGATIPVVDNSTAVSVHNLTALNTAKVRCASTTPIDSDTEVIVQEYIVDPATNALVEIHNIMRGVVVKYTQLTKGKVKNTYEYDISEYAYTLNKYRVHTNGPVSYTVNIPAQALATSIDTILLDTGWVKDGTSPGTNVLEAIQLQYMTVVKALNKFITELGAKTAATPYYLWFDNDAKVVSWGARRNDRTSVNFVQGIYYQPEQYKTVINQASGVIIYGAGMTSVGQYPAVFADHDLAVYQYDDATSNEECAALAFRVYTDFTKDPNEKIIFKLRPNQGKVDGHFILEGDLIQVDGRLGVIIDMTYSPQEIQVGVNVGTSSIIYQLGDRLKPIQGGSSGQTYQSWNPGLQNVGGD